MRAGLFNTDDYLNQWHSADLPEREGEPEAVAETVAAELEATYPDARLEALAEQGGQA